MEPTATACPECGGPVHGAPAGPGPKGMAAVAHSLKTKPGLWIGGVAVVAIAVLAFVGGIFGPSGKTICTATLNQARDYGVISPSAVLDEMSAKSTDVKNRKSCIAKVGEETYTLTADIKSVDNAHKACRDYLKQPGCVALYNAVRADGTTTYQVREIPPNETDEALAKEGLLGIPPAGTSTGGGSETAGGLDSETAVDNSGGMQSAPAQAPQQQQQQQQSAPIEE
ncbi:hypothetical protein GCM10008942_27550 [Rhizomicrobium electricum]|uniref:Uncharacterized protein n=2 Tax=Rhizomicrobium electricum TaxID=480070 RepID=A0ABP3PW71_9PROT